MLRWCPDSIPMMSQQCPDDVLMVCRWCPSSVPAMSRQCHCMVSQLCRRVVCWCDVPLAWDVKPYSPQAFSLGFQCLTIGEQQHQTRTSRGIWPNFKHFGVPVM
jgi:hypothetical protein